MPDIPNAEILESVAFADVREAANRLAGVANRTPAQRNAVVVRC